MLRRAKWLKRGTKHGEKCVGLLKVKHCPRATRSPGQYSYVSDSATDLTASNSFGLMFYNARWYDPALGRFAQADTIVPGGVQGLDRYAYTANNPVRYVDPSGHNWEDCGSRTGYRCQIHMRKVYEVKLNSLIEDITTEVSFQSIEDAQAYLDQVDALQWIYDHRYRTDLEIILEWIISIATDKITGDMAEGIIKSYGLSGISDSIMKALGTMASKGIQDLLKIVKGMDVDEHVAFNYFRDSLASAISKWRNSDDPYGTGHMTIRTDRIILSPDRFSITVFANGKKVYWDEQWIKGRGILGGTSNRFGRLMEAFATNYAPSCRMHDWNYHYWSC